MAASPYPIHMTARAIQQFDVGVKAFIERDGKLLVAQESDGGLWEVPGGRYDVGEERFSPTDILQREVREELGQALRINIDQPFHAWIRPWHGRRAGQFVFLLGFRCTWISGEPQLSPEHSSWRWVTESEAAALVLAPGYTEPVQMFWRKKS